MDCFFSLILCTVERTKECDEFLFSLTGQTDAPPFEVLVVDQNLDGRLDNILEKYQSQLNIRRIQSPRGLSRARNRGLQEATGTFCAIPDDDCRYPEHLLRHVADMLDERKCDLLSLRVTDAAGALSAGFMAGHELTVTRANVWRAAVSTAIFFRRTSILTPFDETLGVGSGTPFGSGEETDFVLNLLQGGARGIYTPQFHVEHPVFNGPWRAERALGYGRGFGRVLRKHHYGILPAGYYAAIQGVRALQFLCKGNPSRARFHLQMARGRLEGYLMKP